MTGRYDVPVLQNLDRDRAKIERGSYVRHETVWVQMSCIALPAFHSLALLERLVAVIELLESGKRAADWRRQLSVAVANLRRGFSDSPRQES
jgi:hypothetical protein